ncbi:MAG: hypothetical protein QM689_11810 [Oscillospiraceae bacterium]
MYRPYAILYASVHVLFLLPTVLYSYLNLPDTAFFRDLEGLLIVYILYKLPLVSIAISAGFLTDSIYAYVKDRTQKTLFMVSVSLLGCCIALNLFCRITGDELFVLP